MLGFNCENFDLNFFNFVEYEVLPATASATALTKIFTFKLNKNLFTKVFIFCVFLFNI